MNKSSKKLAGISVTEMAGSSFQKYMARAVGSFRYRDFFAYEFANALLRNFPGALGIFLRRLFYRRLFGAFGKQSAICESVTFRCPGRLFIGDHTLIDQGVYFDIKSNQAIVQVGNRCQIMHGVCFETGYEGSVCLEDGVFVGPYTILNGQGGLEIGQNSLIAGHCYLVAGNHVFSNPHIPIQQQGFISEGIILEEDVWLGGGVTVLDGVRIGKGSVISAGAVVNQDVESYSIMAGIPARKIRERL